MRGIFLAVACAALVASAETANERLSARMTAANDTRGVMAVYSSQRDGAMRRILLVSVDTILRGRNFPLTNEVEKEIGNDLRSGFPLLVLQAIETSGHLRLKGLAADLKRCFFEADRIDAAYGSGIRQAVIAAFESMEETDWSPVFLEFMLDRRNYWFNGDLLAALRALSRHGDDGCIPHVKQLKARVLRFLAGPGAAQGLEYRQAKCGELIEAILAIESRLSKG